ncbi:hypothetical protein G6F54_013999 [Rhizopus delemar]|nr:hypothetical protein G6F54_013999 [Rhizopus delemar]
MMPGAETGFLRGDGLPNVAGLSPRMTAMNAALSLEPVPTLPSVQRLLQQVHPLRLVGAMRPGGPRIGHADAARPAVPAGLGQQAAADHGDHAPGGRRRAGPDRPGRFRWRRAA